MTSYLNGLERDRMISALTKAVKLADQIMGDMKYGSIKWGLCTPQGYKRWYAEAVACLILARADLSEIDKFAVWEIRQALEREEQ